LDESGAAAIIFSDSYAEIFDDIKRTKKVKSLKTFINMKNDLPEIIAKGQELLTRGETAYLEAKIDEVKTAAIIFTSGTTGLSKGVELTHQGLTYNVVNGHKLIRLTGDTVLVLPLHHTYGFGATIVSTFLLGCTCFINESLKTVLRDIQEAKPQFIAVVPLFVENFHKKIMANIKESGKEKLVGRMSKIVNTTKKVGIDLRRVVFKQILDAFGGNLEILISGGAALNAELVQRFYNFGITIIEGYGITECSPIVSLNRNKWFKAGSVGQVVPGVKVKIAEPNSDGNGEICVKGPIVMNGYYNKPDVTASVLEDGWLRTGDIGHFDDDNFLYITGRKKNLIILANGKNIHPEELEDLIGKLDEVDEVIVKESGKDILAEIYPNYDFEAFRGEERKKIEKAIEQRVKEVNNSLPIYKRIKKIEIRDVEFEKTTTKKIKRW
jgi:long-chain acyl-CoA synthetase